MDAVSDPQVAAVIVSWQPERGPLESLLRRITPQVSRVVVVDNGSEPDVAAWLATLTDIRPACLPLGKNRGLAAAQNAGITWAREQGATHVLLLDDDSEPAPDMVGKLLRALRAMETAGHRVAVVGPRYSDPRHRTAVPFSRVRGFRIERCECRDPADVIPVDSLIASGSLIPLAVLDRIGTMKEELFIDYVDIEWGMRARRAGFQCFGVCATEMHHALGDEAVQFLGRTIALHSPVRHYYMFRNAIWMYRQSSTPLGWKVADGYRLILKYAFYTLFGRPHLEHLKMMSLGIWHGLMGRTGPLDPAR